MQINDLFDYEPLKIYQNENYFKFSLDSILLAEYVDKKLSNKKVLDLCCGNGAILMILAYYGFTNLTGVELQKEIYELARSSIKYNEFNKINLINDDINNISNTLKSESFDIVTINPPYFKVNDESIINDNNVKAIARHEIKLDLDGIFKNASYVLVNNGIMYMVHRSNRLFEIANVAKQYRLTVKEVVLLSPKEDQYEMCLIKFVKNGNDGTKVKVINNLNNYKSYKKMFER